MSVAVLDKQQSFEDLFGSKGVREAANTQPSNQTDARGGLTLDDLIIGVWEGLATRSTVHCPVCGGTMASRSAARTDDPVGEDPAGECLDCGTCLH